MIPTVKQPSILGDDVARQIFGQTIYFAEQPRLSWFRTFVHWLIGE